MQKGFVILLVYALLITIGLVASIAIFINHSRADANEIIGLRNEIDKFGKENRNFEELNNRLEQTIGERDDYKRRLAEIVSGLQNAVTGAGGDIQDAIDRIRECKELAKEIAN